jgi:hypothetical protein
MHPKVLDRKYTTWLDICRQKHARGIKATESYKREGVGKYS